MGNYDRYEDYVEARLIDWGKSVRSYGGKNQNIIKTLMDYKGIAAKSTAGAVPLSLDVQEIEVIVTHKRMPAIWREVLKARYVEDIVTRDIKKRMGVNTDFYYRVLNNSKSLVGEMLRDLKAVS